VNFTPVQFILLADLRLLICLFLLCSKSLPYVQFYDLQIFMTDMLQPNQTPCHASEKYLKYPNVKCEKLMCYATEKQIRAQAQNHDKNAVYG